ncbi:hypothetical protein GCM10011428_49050 [Streptomyces violaceus]
MAAGSEPSATMSPPTWAIRPGAASTSGGNEPVLLRSCHNTNSRTGPVVRRSQRGTRVRREEVGTRG